MVRYTMILFRTPVIKFRKGGFHQTTAGTSASAPAPTSSQPSTAAQRVLSQGQPASRMSTCSIPDIDLPAKYTRTPLSQEEIDMINGGGVI